MQTSEDKALKADSINLLYHDAFGGIIVSLIASGSLAFGFPHNNTVLSTSTWFVVMSLILFIRFMDWIAFKRIISGQPENGQLSIWRFRIGCVSTAAMWSFYGVYYFDHMSLIEFSTTIILLSSMAGGATTVLSADKFSSLCYAAIMIVPVSIFALLSDSNHHFILGVLGISFVGVMMISGIKSAKFTREAIHAKHKNTLLLSSQKKLLNDIKIHNEELESLVCARTEEILVLSNIDPLTGFSNRKAFSSKLKQLIINAQQNCEAIAVLFIDLDGFKSINDQYGHAQGDTVLTKMAEQISHTLKSEHLVCRWGGDEFIVAMPNTGVVQARDFAHELLTTINQTIALGHSRVRLSATIGISMYPEHATNEERLILLADTTMYEQKGKNNASALVFTEQMREQIAATNTLKNGLQNAIENDQLFLVYQPIVDSSSQQTYAYEVLLRWQFNGNVVGPEQFIPLCERYGYIHQIGEWVLRKACQDAQQWSLGENVNICINMSIAQIMHDNIINVVAKALQDSGINPSRVFLEITESIFAEEISHVIKVIGQLKGLGVKVSIDDFGTGFSSLSLLQSLSADVVKIDKIFTDTIEQGGRAIIQATKHIADELNMEIVVEGVESKAQLEALKALNIVKLQGFYFSKPKKLIEHEENKCKECKGCSTT